MATDTEAEPVASRSPSGRRLLLIMTAVFAAVLLSPLLPDIALDTWFADAVVRLTDTATWTQLTGISVAVVVIVVTRTGLSPRRRLLEMAVISLTMLVVLAGNALLNEHVVKPVFAVPRPNIEALAIPGDLGPSMPDGESFYAIGGKEARRLVLAERLPAVETPALSGLVLAHWIHETGYSFASGHTTAAMTFMVMLAALGLMWLDGRRRIFTLWIVPVWAVFVAYSRVLLEVHTPIDVIGATLVGFMWGMVAVAAIVRLAGHAPSGWATVGASSLAP